MLDPAQQAQNNSFVYEALGRLRSRLLDLSKRNRLLNFRDSKKSVSVVDELPNQVFSRLVMDCEEMQFIPLPDIEEEGASEEQTLLFERDESEVGVEYSEPISVAEDRDQKDSVSSLATVLSSKKIEYIQHSVNKMINTGREHAIPDFYSTDSPVDTYACAYAKSILKKVKTVEEVTAEPVDTVTDETADEFSPEAINTDVNLPEAYSGEIKVKHDDDFLQTCWESAVLERRCKAIAQDAKSAIEETGSNLLYLAIGFLEWKEATDSTVSYRAPLILVPVAIEKKKLDPDSQCYRYSLAYTEEDIKTNLSLTHKLEKDFGIALPEFNTNGADDDAAICLPEKYLAEVTRVISSFPSWKVKRHMVLGFFSFSKILIYEDLDPEIWSKQGQHIVDHPTIPGLLAGIGQSPQGGDESPHGLPFGEDYLIDEIPDPVPVILDADSSQHSAIIDVINNEKNLVIEGPPGTGKSQTIANIISAGLNAGKSILFLSEKKAALDVVKRRLDSVGLGDFCFELHSHKSRKATAYEDLKRRLESSYFENNDLRSKASQREIERVPLSSYAQMISGKIGSTELTTHEIFMAAQRWRAECGDDFVGCEINSIDLLQTLSPELIHKHEVFLSDLSACIDEIPIELRFLWIEFFSRLNIDYKKIVPGDEEWVTSGLNQIRENAGCVANVITEKYPNVAAPGVFGEDYRGLLTLDVNLVKDLLKSPLSELFKKLIYSHNRKTLQRFLTSLTAVKGVEDRVAKYFNLEAISHDTLETLQQKTIKIESYGYGSVSLVEASELSASLRTVIDLLSTLTGFSSKYLPALSGTIQAIKEFVDVSSLVADSPESLRGSEVVNLVGEKPRSLYKSLRTKCKRVSSEKIALAEKFNLRLLPHPDEIVSLARQLKIGQGKAFSFLSGPFRRAKQELAAFSSESVKPKEPAVVEDLLALADLIKLEKEVEQELRAAKNLFGDYIDGFDTDWEALGHSLKWVYKLTNSLCGESCARTILADPQEAFSSINSDSLEVRRLLLLLDEARSKLDRDRVDERKPLSDLSVELTQIETSLADFLSAANLIFSNHEFALGQTSSLIADAQRYSEAVKGLDSDHIRDLLGTSYQGVSTDSHTLDSLLTQFEGTGLGFVEFSEFLGPIFNGEGLSAVVEFFEGIDPSLSKLDESVQAFSDKFAHRQNDSTLSFVEYWDLLSAKFEDSSLPAFEQAITSLSHLSDASMYFQSVTNIYRSKAHGASVGFLPELNCIIDLLENSKLSRDKALALYRANIYHGCALKIFRKFPDLSLFSRSTHENIIKRFQGLDKEIIKQQRSSTAFNAARRNRHMGTRGGRKSEWTEGSLLEHQVNLKRRHLALRQLVKRAGKAVLSYKPCFMMSPLSVAQYLPPGYLNFDLVVMDEASQMRPEDALGGIIRGKQLVVVGDPKQLPPTNFFSSLGNTADADEDDGYAIEDAESILDICLSTFPSRRLRWHYRSEHEKLIQFSNSRFYDDDLLVFPSPYHENRHYGVYHHYVEDGAYTARKGENLIEAQTVVEAIVKHLENHSDHSLGVATFNQAQRDLIRDLLETRAKGNSKLERLLSISQEGDEPFFVKNLENVQGDERDVIFISTTFGPDSKTDRVFQRFGPINSDVGWRRLNVIITRAKKRLELFTSLRSGDIIVGDNSHKGVVALKDYLAFAETGYIPDRGVISGREPDSDFEIDVASVLSDYGYETKAQVGVAGFFIDLAVVNPHQKGDFILGLECDGASYHSAKSARDRDRIRQEVLEAKGWKIHRIWSTDWFVNRDKEIERLRTTLHALSMDYKAKHKVEDIIEIPVVPVEREIPQRAVENDSKDTVKETIVDDKDFSESEDIKLRHELLEYRKLNIEADFGISEDNILRDQMLNVLIQKKPIAKDEFLRDIPLPLRERTSIKQAGLFLKDIFEIIEEYV